MNIVHRKWGGAILWQAMILCLATWVFGLCASAQNLNITEPSNWYLVGDAFVENGNTIVLTSNDRNKAGAAWFRQAIDIRRDFEMAFEIYLGDRDSQGGDGMAFVMHRDVRGFETIGEGDAGMGFADVRAFQGSGKIMPSLGIEFDTNENTRPEGTFDPEYDHIAVNKNGNLQPAWAGPNYLGRELEYNRRTGRTYYSYTDFEDGEWHDVIIRWDASSKTLNVSFDGETVISMQEDITKNHFRNDPVLNFGWTASTGSKKNKQAIRPGSITGDQEDLDDDGNVDDDTDTDGDGVDDDLDTHFDIAATVNEDEDLVINLSSLLPDPSYVVLPSGFTVSDGGQSLSNSSGSDVNFTAGDLTRDFYFRSPENNGDDYVIEIPGSPDGRLTVDVIPVADPVNMVFSSTVINVYEDVNGNEQKDESEINTFFAGNGYDVAGGSSHDLNFEIPLNFNLSNVEIQIDFPTYDNELTIEFGDANLTGFLNATEVDPNSQVEAPWQPNQNGLPRGRVILKEHEVFIYATETSSSESMILVTRQSYPTGTSLTHGRNDVLVTNVDGPGPDSVRGVITWNYPSSADITGQAGAFLPVTIAASLQDNDGSEEIYSIVISGIPAGVRFGDGRNRYTSPGAGGTVDITSWRLNSMTVLVPASAPNSFSVNVAATSRELENDSRHTTTLPMSIEVFDLDTDGDGINDSIECPIFIPRAGDWVVDNSLLNGGNISITLDGIGSYVTNLGRDENIPGYTFLDITGGVSYYRIEEWLGDQSDSIGGNLHFGMAILDLGRSHGYTFFNYASGDSNRDKARQDIRIYGANGNILNHDITGEIFEIYPTGGRFNEAFQYTIPLTPAAFGVDERLFQEVMADVVAVEIRSELWVGLSGIEGYLIPAGTFLNGCPDTDGDGIFDHQDPDSDNDGIPDEQEGIVDSDNDGLPDYRDEDDDNDGLLTKDEIMPVEFANDPDEDGIPNWLDTDSDGDGILDAIERFSNPELGDVGTEDGPAFLDLDSDGDGISDTAEIGGNVLNILDTDNDGIPDYLDQDAQNDGYVDGGETIFCGKVLGSEFNGTQALNISSQHWIRSNSFLAFGPGISAGAGQSEFLSVANVNRNSLTEARNSGEYFQFSFTVQPDIIPVPESITLSGMNVISGGVDGFTMSVDIDRSPVFINPTSVLRDYQHNTRLESEVGFSTPYSINPGDTLFCRVYLYSLNDRNGNGTADIDSFYLRFCADYGLEIEPEDDPGVVHKDKILLPVTIRDVHADHPNFEEGATGHVTGIVRSQLASHGKPVWDADAIAVNDHTLTNENDFNQWWNDTPGISKTIPAADIVAGDARGSKLELTYNGDGTYSFEDTNFFPLHKDSVRPGSTLEPFRDNNYHFTMEIHTQFTYVPGLDFQFRGDDDVWVFINDRLVVDIGGVHEPVTGYVDLDTLGLTEGETYDFDMFFAERQTVGSNFLMTTSIVFDEHPEDNTDSDGDGVPDRIDLDDDNDGILDVVEDGAVAGGMYVAAINGSFEYPGIEASWNSGDFIQRLGTLGDAAVLLLEDDIAGWRTTAGDSLVEIRQSGFNGIDSYDGNQYAEVNATQSASLFQEIATTPGEVMRWTFAHRGLDGEDTVEVRIGSPGSQGTLAGSFSSGNDEWYVYEGEYVVPEGQRITRMTFRAVESATGSLSAGNLIDGIRFAKVSAASLDTDGDGIVNSLDLDSDGDGVPDNLEAQKSHSYVAPTGNFDGLGVDLAYIGGLIPVNSNGAGDPDYLSLDSDGDGISDSRESGLTVSGSLGVNGLDDSIDTSDDYSDVNGTIASMLALRDSNGNITGGGEPDIRERFVSADPGPVTLISNDCITTSGVGPNGIPNIRNVFIPAGANRAVLIVASFERDHCHPGDDCSSEDSDDLGDNYAAPGFRGSNYQISARLTGEGGIIERMNPLVLPEGDLRYLWAGDSTNPSDPKGSMRFSHESYYVAFYEQEINYLLNGQSAGEIHISLPDVAAPTNEGDEAILKVFIFDNVEQTSSGIVRSGTAVNTDFAENLNGNFTLTDESLDLGQQPDEPNDGFLVVGQSFTGLPTGSGGFRRAAGMTVIGSAVSSNTGGRAIGGGEPDGFSMTSQFRNGPNEGVIDSFTITSAIDQNTRVNGGIAYAFTIESVGATNTGGEGLNADPFDVVEIPRDGRSFLFQNNPSDLYTVDLLTGESRLLVEDIWPTSDLNGGGYNELDGHLWLYGDEEGELVKIGGDFIPHRVPIEGFVKRGYFTGDINGQGIMVINQGGGRNVYVVIDLNPESETYLTVLKEFVPTNMGGAGGFADMSFNPVDGLLYGVGGDFKLNRLDFENETIESLGVLTLPTTGGTTFGGQFFDSSGNLYISQNQTGDIFRIPTPHNIPSGGSSVQANFFTSGPKSSLNDGARSAYTPIRGTGEQLDDGCIGCTNASDYETTGGAQFKPATESYQITRENPDLEPAFEQFLLNASLWVDARNIKGDGTNPPNGTLLNEWKDLTVNRNHTVQSGSDGYPMYMGSRQAVRFSGRTYLRAVDAPSLDLSQGMTVLYVATLNDNDTGVVFDKGGDNGVEHRIQGNGRTWVKIDDGDRADSVQTTSDLSTNENQRSIFTLRSNGSNVELGINGIQELTTTALDGINNTSDPFIIGQSLDGRNGLKGDVNEMIVWNRYLTDLEIHKVEIYLTEKWNISRQVEENLGEFLRSASVWLDGGEVLGNHRDPANGSTINNWDDLTHNENDANQSSNSRAPEFNAGNESGDFDGSSFMEVSEDSSLVPDEGITLLYVGTPRLGGNQVVASYDGNDGWMHRIEPSGQLWSLISDGSNSESVMSSASMAAADGVRSLFGTRLTRNQANLYLNGVRETASVSRSRVAEDGARLVIGALGAGNQHFQGSLNEFIYFNRALTDLEILKLETYLVEKWDLQDNVPLTHPGRDTTPILESNVGAVWYNNPINLEEDFYLQTDLYLGSNESGKGGVTITLQNSIDEVDTQPGSIENLGAVSPGFGIYFKTYSEGADPSYDHVGFYENGVIVPIGPSPARINPNSDNVEDGTWHSISVEWDADEQIMNVYYEGELIQTIQRDIILTAFGGDPEVYVGFTASSDPDQPNSYGAKICEFKTPDPSLDRFTLTTRSTGSEGLASQGVILDENLTIISNPADAVIDGALVMFRSPFDPSIESLGVFGQSGTSGAINGLNWAFDPSTGIMTLNGDAQVNVYQTALRQVAYFNSDYLNSPGMTHDFSISLGLAMPFTGRNGSFSIPHFYQVLSRTDAMSWLEARKLAASKNYLGHQGYLATITSAEENAVLAFLTDGNEAWLGAGDASRDKEWRWLTGPESYEDSSRGRIFYLQNGVPGQTSADGAVGGYSYRGYFANWQTGKPDDLIEFAPEEYAVISSDGEWDDRSLFGQGQIHHYIVEYGGLKGELNNRLYSALRLNLGRSDEDDDGVPDEEDNCLGTVPGAQVDAFGCAIPTFNAADVVGVMETAIPLSIQFGSVVSTNDFRIYGLPDGAVLSHGFQTRSGHWLVPYDQIENVAVVPPKGHFGLSVLTIAQPGNNLFTRAHNGTFGSGNGQYGGHMLNQYTDFQYTGSQSQNGRYTVTKSTPWIGSANIRDRQDPGNGYMAVFDLQEQIDLVEYAFDNLTPHATYEFSFWMANLNNPLGSFLEPINLAVLRSNEGYLNTVYETGAIAGLRLPHGDPQRRWEHHGVNLVNQGGTEIALNLRNMASSITGNDVALDDIRFSQLVVDTMSLMVLGPEIIAEDTQGYNNELIPVDIERNDIQSARPFLVRGVIDGAELSHGKKIGRNTWVVGANSIENLSILAPNDFEGDIPLEIVQYGSNLSITGRDLAELNNVEVGDASEFNRNINLLPRVKETFDPDGTPLVVIYAPENTREANNVVAHAVRAIYEMHQAAYLTYTYRVPHTYHRPVSNLWSYTDTITFRKQDDDVAIQTKLDNGLTTLYLALEQFLGTQNQSLPDNWPLGLPRFLSGFWAPANGHLAVDTTLTGLVPEPDDAEDVFNATPGSFVEGGHYRYDTGSVASRFARMTGSVTVTNFTETIAVTAGEDYTLSFSMRNTGSTEDVAVSARINGAEVFTSLNIINDGDWNTYVSNWNSGVSTAAVVEITTTGATGFDADVTLGDVELAEQITTGVTVSVFAADNIPPVAMSTVIQISDSSPVPVDVVTLSWDNEGLIDPTSVAIVTLPTKGSVIVDPVTGVVTYTPAAGPEDDEFTYFLKDDIGNVSNVGKIILAKTIIESAPDDLIGYWAFDETAGLVAIDSSSFKNHGQLNNFTEDGGQWVPGQLSNALEFGGPATEQFVLVPNYPKVTTHMSVSAWVWASSYQNYATIIKNWGEGTTGQFHFDLGEPGNSGTVTVGQPDSTPPLEPVNYRPGNTNSVVRLGGVRTNPGTGGVEVSQVNPIALNAWNHYAMVADGTHIILYHNGVELQRKPYNGQFNTANVDALGIGAKLDDFGTGAAFETPGFLDGRLDDLAMWNRALTPSEIATIYSDGLAGVPILGERGSIQAPSITRDPEALEVSAGLPFSLGVQFDGSSPLVVQWYKDGAPIAGATDIAYAVESAHESDGGTYSVRVTNAAGSATSASVLVSVVKTDRLHENLALYYRFDDGDGSEPLDDSGNNNHAEIITGGLPPVWSNGLFDGAIEFDGDAAGMHGKVNSFSVSTNAVSVSAWVKAQTMPAYASIIRNYGDTSGTGLFSLGLNGASPRISNTVALEGGEETLVSDTDMQTDTWTHVAVVIAANRHYLFQNGELVAQGSGGTFAGNPMDVIGIGGRLGDNGDLSSGFPHIWDGQIDDVAVWGRALTSLEVRSLYNKGLVGESLGQLLGNLPVHIVGQPQSVKTAEGLPVTLTTEIEGPATVFQWYKDGQPLPSQIESTLVIESATTDDSGEYQLVAGNSLGTITSDAVVIEVISISGLSNGVVGYWPFNETSGHQAADHSGNGSHGELRGYLTDSDQWVPGKAGNALDFGGFIDQHYVFVPSWQRPDTELSISVWVKPEYLDYDATIVKNWGDGTSLSGADVLGQFQLGLASTTGEVAGIMPLTQDGTSTAIAQSTGTQLSTTDWTHVTMVYNAPDATDLVNDGVFDNGLASWSATGTVSSTGGEVRLGEGDAPGENTLSQVLSTVSGETYTLSFDYRDNSIFAMQSLRVYVDGNRNLLTSTHLTTSINGDTYVTHTFEFTADSSSTTLRFVDTSDTSGLTNRGSVGVDGYLDNISVANRSGGTMSLYLNARLVDSAPMSTIKSNPLISALGIGVRLNDAGTGPAWDMSYWDGLIDELTIWNRGISVNEIAAIHSLGFSSKGLSDVIPAFMVQSLEPVEGHDMSRLNAGSTDQPVTTANDVFGEPQILVTQENGVITLIWPAGMTLQGASSITSDDWNAVGGEAASSGFLQLQADNLESDIQFFRLESTPVR